jgi:hypothetical protein
MRLLQTIIAACVIARIAAQEVWVNETPDLIVPLRGNGKFVTAGDIIQSSPDLTNWTKIGVGPFSVFGSGAFGNGRFLISDRALTAASEDGLNWTYRTNLRTSKITFAQSNFWAVGTRPGEYDHWGHDGPYGIFRSSDGNEWQQMFRPSISLQNLLYGNGIFVTYGETNDVYGSVTQVYASTDGNAWTLRSSLKGANPAVSYFANDRFFAVTNWPTPNVLNVSVDCATWTNSITLPTTNAISRIIWRDNRYMAFTWRGEIFTSPDAADWTLEKDLNRWITAPLETETGLFLFGQKGVIYFSPAPGEWQKIARVSDVPSDALAKVIYWNGKFFANGPQGVAASDDGIKWNWSLTTTNPIKAMLPAGRNLFAFSADERYRFDGSVWSKTNLNVAIDPYQVAYDGEKFVSVTSRSVYTSLDGIEWTQTFTNWYFFLQKVAYGNGVFVAGGDQWGVACPAMDEPCELPDPSTIPQEFAVVSTNGITWDRVKIFDPEWPLEGFAFGNGKFVATHMEYDPKISGNLFYEVVRTSTNGYDWTTVPPTNPPLLPGSLTFANGLFFLAHYNGVSISTDAEHWEFHPANNFNVASIAYGKLRYVGLNGHFMISDQKVQIASTANGIQLGLGAGENGSARFEQSSDLLTWRPVDGVFGGATFTTDASGSPAMFYRAASAR